MGVEKLFALLCPACLTFFLPPQKKLGLDITGGIFGFCNFLSLMWLPRWNNLEFLLFFKENISHKFNFQPRTHVTETQGRVVTIVTQGPFFCRGTRKGGTPTGVSDSYCCSSSFHPVPAPLPSPKPQVNPSTLKFIFVHVLKCQIQTLDQKLPDLLIGVLLFLQIQ